MEIIVNGNQISAPSGYWLTRRNGNEKTFTKIAYLAVGDSAENWTLATDAEKEQAEQEDAPTSPADLRRQAYANERLIEWEGELITVDVANGLYLAYIAENDTAKSSELTAKIQTAKNKIRENYPD